MNENQDKDFQMDNASSSNQQLQQANRQLDETLESANSLMDAGTTMIWVVIIIIIAGFAAGMLKALFSKNQSADSDKGQRNDKNASTNTQSTIGGKIALGILLVVLIAIFVLVAYSIIQYA